MMRGKGMLDRLADVTAWSETPLPGQTLLELLDDRRILIEHHSGVTEYTQEKIQVRVDYGSLCIAGTELRLTKMSPDQLVINGRIISVTLTRER